mgnify:CR=1 FL=1
MFIFFYFYFGNEEVIKRRFKLIYISYSCLIIFNVTYSFAILPQFTYEEAMELVERNLGKQVDKPPKGDVKAQLGRYFIYTNDEVYIFNAETGSYTARTPLGN